MPSWRLPCRPKPISAHFQSFSLDVFILCCVSHFFVLVVWAVQRVVGCLRPCVNPQGRQHKGKWSQGQGCHGHGVVSIPNWGIPVGTRLMGGYFPSFFGRGYIVGCVFQI